MARGDGIHRTSARNEKIIDADVGKIQSHNERENESYSNQDIVPERTSMNVHFKTPTAAYTEMFEQMVADGTISTRGLKADADKFGELVFDVNSAYFYNHGGYDFAKQFYADAYKAAIEIVGGEQYILSAVMHADERNRAMSDALGHDVYHYHLHVVYVPVVEKEVKWTRRCKDPSLVGKVKERITQVSMSKKWESKPVLGEDGKPLKTKTGKAVLKPSYSVLQDDFFEYMRAAGYTDVERGERGSTEEHLTVTQFKVMKEQERLSELQEARTEIQSEIAELQEAHAKETEKLDKTKERIQKQKLDLKRIDEIEAKPTLIGNKVTVDKDDFDMVITAAKKHITQEKKESALQKALDAAHKMITELKNTVADLTRKLTAATKELSEYKSVRNKLNAANVEQENERLRNRLRTYEEVISRNNLWSYFSRNRGKTTTRDENR
ncbi:plasmid recombination protein [Intestinimonas butyriciproducens]|uniref:plasmid recombination protein n=1 Tax=Intestinimonas butyriciproducens TaxID=1297617 RepID=UPI00233019EA|nr:plasmid recombination protein [Intestinimonas butyriciproducens]MDB7860208.1 plasmid recombination protein [Intestinimonas butyriciproducens]